MAKFVTGTELTLTIEQTITTAQQYLYLVAPAIQLPAGLKEALRHKKLQDGLQLVVAFGNPTKTLSDSVSESDLSFFKEFPNVVIAFAQKLGATYYANENTALLTSVNLANFTDNTTIQSGMVLTAHGMLKQLAGTLTNTITETEKSSFETAHEYFVGAIAKSHELFRKTPQYDKGFLNLNKKYNRSVVEVNRLDEFFAAATAASVASALAKTEPVAQPVAPAIIEEKPFVTGYKCDKPAVAVKPEPLPEPAAYEPTPAPTPAQAQAADEFQPGFCVRTGAAIFFNPRNPMTAQAMTSWRKESDGEFPENYCHFSGEPSYGQTSVNRPILQKNLRKAQGFL